MVELSVEQVKARELFTQQFKTQTFRAVNLSKSHSGNMLLDQEPFSLTVEPRFNFGEKPEDAKWEIWINNGHKLTTTFKDADRDAMIDYCAEIFSRTPAQIKELTS